MILASQSPRRIELMRQAGFSPRILPAHVDESRLEGEDPIALVRRLSEKKARALLPQAAPDEVVLAADTIVAIGGHALGKPSDEDDARVMLHALSGKTHQVATGVCILRGEECTSFVEVTDVTFFPLSDTEIDAYIATGDPLDKAGAYGIQGMAGRTLVSSISGDYYNVVGLPIARVVRKLKEMGVSPSGIAEGGAAEPQRPPLTSGEAKLGAEERGPAPIPISAIADFRIGHWTDGEAGTGCTAIVAPKGAVGGVDVRGGAPASRETDLLKPENTVGTVHAVVLSGGSAFGLEAASGAARELERRGIGLPVGPSIVPIVCSSCLFDLGFADPDVRPGAEQGAIACARALDDGDAQAGAEGNVGAGTGATVGKLLGAGRAMKGGLGARAYRLGALQMGAVAAVNACGNVCDPASGRAIAGARDAASGTSIVDAETEMLHMSSEVVIPLERANTTISCIITNARLTKAQATKVAQIAADAYAHVIRPTHTTNDGDTIYVLASCSEEAPELPLDAIGLFATFVLEQALAAGCREATGAHGLPSSRDLLRQRSDGNDPAGTGSRADDIPY